MTHPALFLLLLNQLPHFPGISRPCTLFPGVGWPAFLTHSPLCTSMPPWHPSPQPSQCPALDHCSRLLQRTPSTGPSLAGSALLTLSPVSALAPSSQRLFPQTQHPIEMALPSPPEEMQPSAKKPQFLNLSPVYIPPSAQSWLLQRKKCPSLFPQAKPSTGFSIPPSVCSQTLLPHPHGVLPFHLVFISLCTAPLQHQPASA